MFSGGGLQFPEVGAHCRRVSGRGPGQVSASCWGSDMNEGETGQQLMVLLLL